MPAVHEAARADTAPTQGFFYETVAPILSVGSASLVAISTLTSEINFYTRLIKVCAFCMFNSTGSVLTRWICR